MANRKSEQARGPVHTFTKTFSKTPTVYWEEVDYAERGSWAHEAPVWQEGFLKDTPVCTLPV